MINDFLPDIQLREIPDGAKARLHMEGAGKCFVETRDNCNGFIEICKLRDKFPLLFKRRHIKNVIQFKPSEVPLGVIVFRNKKVEA